MPMIPALDEEALAPELYEQLTFFHGTLGVIPNSVRTMAHRPEIAQAFTALNKTVMRDYGAVTPEFKRLVGYVSSYASGCMYCQAHMILASERFGASEERLGAVWDFEDSPHFSEAEKAALALAQGATEVPNAVTEAHWARMREHWSTEAITEIMSVISLFGFLNRWNDSMGTALEDIPREKGETRLADPTGWQIGKHLEA